MQINKTFTVPSYYKNFICKAGVCRHTCCEDLSINITQEEYLRLVGLDCSSSLREKLDLALYVLSHPDEYKYACISPTYTGQCRMLDEKGLCALQNECGYDVLTSVCKYFPRHPVITGYPECSMANACEATLELFLNDNETWDLEETLLSFTLAGQSDAKEDSPMQDNHQLRHKLIAQMADDTLSLVDRLQKISSLSEKMLTLNNSDIPHTELPAQASHTLHLPEPINQIKVHTRALIRLLQTACENYPDLTLPARRTKDRLAELAGHGHSFDEPALSQALDELQTYFSNLTSPVDFNRYFGKVLANGMFYHGFPFGNLPVASHALHGADSLSCSQEKLTDALTVLHYAVYLLVVLFRANTSALSTPNKLVDLTAAFSRMADLADFGRLVLTAHQSTDSDFPGGISA